MHKEDKDISITQIFNAPVEAVWKAWAEPEMVKKWWGPKGFTAPEIKIDLRVGGNYLYCMRGSPAPGVPVQDFWSTGEYKEIIPLKKIVITDSFSDKFGNKVDPKDYGMNENFPKETTITVLFEKQPDYKTKLTISYLAPKNGKGYQAMIESGMEEGWKETLNKLEEILRKNSEGRVNFVLQKQ